MRRLSFFPDYRADPIWDADDGCMVNLDDIPCRPGTRDSLRAWAERWEALAWERTSTEDGEASTPDDLAQQRWREVEHDGQQLCAALQLELGDDWIVE